MHHVLTPFGFWIRVHSLFFSLKFQTLLTRCLCLFWGFWMGSGASSDSNKSGNFLHQKRSLVLGSIGNQLRESRPCISFINKGMYYFVPSSEILCSANQLQHWEFYFPG